MLISALLLLNTLVFGLPVPTKTTTTHTAKQTAEIQYVSISDITDTDDGFDNNDDEDESSTDGWIDEDDDEDDDDIDEDASKEEWGYSELPTYDDPRRGRRRSRNNKEWKINLNRTKG